MKMIRTVLVCVLGSCCFVLSALGQEAGIEDTVSAPTTGMEPVEASTLRHTVVQGDTMWDLAMRYYKDHFKWRRISDANPPPNVDDPHWIYPGQVLVIPGLDGASEPEIESAPEVVSKPAPPAEPEPAEQPEPAPEPADAEPLVAAEPVEVKTGDLEPLPESFSTRLPEGLVGQSPSTTRFKARAGWKEDGVVLKFEGRESVAAQGDWVDVQMKDPGSVSKGQRYIIFRRSGPTEIDHDKNAVYLAKIGVLEIIRPLQGMLFRAKVVQSGDGIQTKDILKRVNRP